MDERTLHELVHKPYRIKLYPIGEGTDSIEWVAEIPDLPGCVGCGDTPEEALAMVVDAKKSWLETALIDGINIPEPKNPDNAEYSGKFTLRIPKSLHKELTLRAEEEGVSLNQYIIFLITKNHYESSDSQDTTVYREEIRRTTIKTPLIVQRWPELGRLNFKGDEYVR